MCFISLRWSAKNTQFIVTCMAGMYHRVFILVLVILYCIKSIIGTFLSTKVRIYRRTRQFCCIMLFRLEGDETIAAVAEDDTSTKHQFQSE